MNLKITNQTDQWVTDCVVDVPNNLLNKLPLGTYKAIVDGKELPLEVASDIFDAKKVIFIIENLMPNETKIVKIVSGNATAYPKRTYAELAHKIGGKFKEGTWKYEGGFSWVKPNRMALAGNFHDHSYYIKYEGPGWENDRVAFRFYLDNRNAIDVFGKKTSEIVLPAVGVDGYDNYHAMADWGMDNLQVGKALGLGSIAFWDGKQAQRVEKRDSTLCEVLTDGKLRSQIRTIYYGWQAGGNTYELHSLISIDAGTRLSHIELTTDKPVANIATGIIKRPDTELIKNENQNGEWSYIATFGKQSLNNDMQGLAVFFRTKQLQKTTEDALNQVIVLSQDEKNYVDYYIMPTWELDVEPTVSKDDFIKCIENELKKLNLKVKIK
ncbi:hypothetical protein FACS189429_6880 [Bacteroidia bacterium]|nr:hypothetical protein FACS189429_6880 [Bacteroidia bacterium]